MTKTQFLIGLRVFCGLLWVSSSSSVAAMPRTAGKGWSLRLRWRDLSCHDLFLLQSTDSQCGARSERQDLTATAALTFLESLAPELQATYVLPAYFNELKMSGRDFNNSSAPDFGSYRRGFAAINALFPASQYQGKIDLSQPFQGHGPDNPNNIKGNDETNTGYISTIRGGNIQLLAPGGPITVGQLNGTAGLNSGIATVRGGSISTYSAGSLEGQPIARRNSRGRIDCYLGREY